MRFRFHNKGALFIRSNVLKIIKNTFLTFIIYSTKNFYFFLYQKNIEFQRVRCDNYDLKFC